MRVLSPSCLAGSGHCDRLLRFRCYQMRNSGKQRKEQRVLSLFFQPRNWRRSRVSAENENSLAVNLQQKQQKQRKGATRRYRPCNQSSTRQQVIEARCGSRNGSSST